MRRRECGTPPSPRRTNEVFSFSAKFCNHSRHCCICFHQPLVSSNVIHVMSISSYGRSKRMCGGGGGAVSAEFGSKSRKVRRCVECIQAPHEARVGLGYLSQRTHDLRECVHRRHLRGVASVSMVPSDALDVQK